jgi:hypothetical protein
VNYNQTFQVSVWVGAESAMHGHKGAHTCAAQSSWLQCAHINN